MSHRKPPSLEPSELGEKEYWDTTYTHDLTTHTQTPSHTGTDWFSDVNASSKILRYLSSDSLDLNKETTSFLDLGTGNGEMLFQLRSESEFEGRMVGVDYSPASVQLCHKRLQALRSEEHCIEDIAFEVWDILKDAPMGEWRCGFDVVLDKGTFDAVSLSEEGCEGYRERVEPLVREGGCLVVTSCNWTEEELGVWFEGGALVKTGRVEYPVFRFGGGMGQSVATVCFRKKG